MINPGFHEQLFDIDAHYQMKVHNLAISSDKKSPTSITYSIQGDNNRIVSDSTDNSTNMVVKNGEALKIVEEMKKLLTSTDLSDSDKHKVSELIEEIENQAKAKSTSRVVMWALEKLGKIAPSLPLSTAS